ncbi:unnamed protein product [Peronospora belbahrii]|uniref:AMP-binding enzyme C-terminal domain-containing protein n=1 Tax=Peronospora belbahrii TaxID=622444 RepID=A0ABN8CT34_9STRA|nr:unnamed protein product [Peronospora belbahrii]
MMTSLITNTIDNKLTFEELLIVTLLATTAFFLVALGGALYHKSKQKDEKVPVSQLHNKIEISAETVLTDLKRYAMSDAWRHKIVYTFLDDLGRETINLSFKEIDQAARKIVTVLQRDVVVRKGDKVILCYPPGLDFALAFGVVCMLELWAFQYRRDLGARAIGGYRVWNRSRYTEKMFNALTAGAKSSSNMARWTGRNVCPQDVETSVEHRHEYVRPGCTAAFSIENGDEEALVVVTEVRNGSSLQTLEVICREIIEIVLLEHHLKCEAIVLLRQKTVPKTTSGKIQRSAAKTHFLNGTLHEAFDQQSCLEKMFLGGKCKTPGDIPQILRGGLCLEWIRCRLLGCHRTWVNILASGDLIEGQGKEDQKGVGTDPECNDRGGDWHKSL